MNFKRWKSSANSYILSHSSNSFCREHARVVTLLTKMEQLREAPLPFAVHAALRELHDAIKVLQQCRINERQAILQHLRGEIIRFNEDLGSLFFD